MTQRPGRPQCQFARRLGWVAALAAIITVASNAAAQPVPGGDAPAAAAPTSAPPSVHDFRAFARGAAWITWVTGDVKDTSGSGRLGTIQIDDDLGFDDATAQFFGMAGARAGRHDFFVTAFRYDESESERLTRSISFGELIAPITREVETDLELTDVNFGYSYALFTTERHGFRFGPSIAVSYTDFKIKVRDKVTQASDDIKETFPAPTFGFRGEVPFGNVAFEFTAAGVWIDAGSFDGWAFRGRADAIWRPVRHFGIFAGIHGIWTDVSFNNEDVEAALFGPLAGIELRF